VTLDQKVYAKIINEFNSKKQNLSLEAYIAKRVKEIQYVIQEMQNIYRARKNLEDVYQKSVKELDNKLAGIRHACKHEQVTRNSDVYESYTSCDFCGKDLG
jgi:hypothetical protein